MFGLRPNEERTRAFMVDAHRGQKCWDGRPFYRHPMAVTALATRYGKRVLRQPDSIILPGDRAALGNMWHAAMLHDVMEDAGKTFDDVLEVTDLQVAQYVATISYDNRLPRPRRVMEYANRLCIAEQPIQLIKLADVICNLQDAVQLLIDDPDKAKSCLPGWPEETNEYLAALHKLGAGRLRKQWNWSADTTRRLGTIIRRWSHREAILGEIDECPT